jgi:trk system potassium uptake protein TrkH
MQWIDKFDEQISKYPILKPMICLMGGLSMLLGIFMLPPVLISLIDDHHTDRLGLMMAFSFSFLIGIIAFIKYKPILEENHFKLEDGFLIVAMSWILCAFVGALPYYFFAHFSSLAPCVDLSKQIVGYEFCSLTNGFFEAMSGFSTTGASVINVGLWETYIDGVGRMANGELGLPRGILLWRSITHFLGGMGIVVLGVAILPSLGVGAFQLYRAEVTGLGAKTDKLSPKIQETAKILWIVYVMLTLILAGIYFFAGMDFYESINHSMSTMATGGFSTRSISIGGFHSSQIEWITIFFMLLAAINFNLHYFFLFKKQFSIYFQDIECKAYLLTVLIASTLIAISIYLAGDVKELGDAIRIAIFNVLSLITTTGYANTNFELWQAPLAIFILILLLLSGGCASSTSGGIKIIRHLILFKLFFREFFYLLNPRAQKNIKINDESLPRETIRGVASFLGLYIWIAVIGTALFIILGEDLLTAFTCTISSLGNVGPGLGKIGPYDNYLAISDLGKWLSSFLMMMGRLELYTVLILLMPSYWKH